MRLKHIIKQFCFSEDNRARLEFGPNTRLRPEANCIQLKATAGAYPTTADLFVKTWVANPRSMKRWVGFMVDMKNVAREGVALTSVKYRLGDGATQMFWDVGTSAWVAASASDWNTESEVAAHISTFPSATQNLQVIVNIKTDDSSVTPTVSEIRVLYESDLEELEDYVWRSLLPSMRSAIRPIAEHAVEMDATSAAISLNDFKIETPYDIKTIDAVYDIDADPKKLSNLFQSYNDATKIITLTAAVPSGNACMIRFTYAPPIAVTTSQDYTESEKVPEILIENITKLDDRGQVGVDYVINKETGEGWKVPLTQADIECSGRFVSDKAKDHARLADAIRRYFYGNELLRTVGMDEDVRLHLLSEYSQDTQPSQRELHVGRFRFRIVQALFFDNDAVAVTGVLRFGLTMTRQ